VVLTGPGEPSISETLEMWVHGARRGGAVRVALTTNGRLLAYPQTARRIAALGIDAVAVTLRHPSAAIHDRRVRVEGAHAQTLAGLRNLARSPFRRRMSLWIRCPDPLDVPATTALARLGGILGVDGLWLDGETAPLPPIGAGSRVVDRGGFEARLLSDLPPARTRDGAVPIREHPDEGAVSMVVRTGCRNACVFCTTRLIQEQNRAAWPLEDLDAFVGPLEQARERGFDALRMVAVEPLEHPDMASFLGRMSRSGFRRIEAWTSARALADRRWTDDLVGAGLTHVDVPLFGGDPAVHDRVAGVGGAFAETLEGLDAARGALDVRYHLVVVRQNLGDLGGMVRLGRRLGLGEPASVLIPGPSVEEPATYQAFAFSYADAMASFRSQDEGVRSVLEARGFLQQIPPCVSGRAAVAGERGARPVGIRDGRLNEPGAAAKLRVRCSLSSRCADASRCPGHHRGYEEAFGTEGLNPREDR